MRSNDIPMLLAASWRCQCMCVFLLPLAWIEHVFWLAPQDKPQWLAYKPDLMFPVFVHVILAGLFW
jgi:hypothetical protein